MLPQVRHDAARMQTVRLQPPTPQLLRQTPRVQAIRRLGLPVRPPLVVLLPIIPEPRIREPHRPQLVPLAADNDDARGAAGTEHPANDGVAEDEVAQVAGAELQLEAVRGRAVRAGHDAGVEDERVDDGAGALHGDDDGGGGPRGRERAEVHGDGADGDGRVRRVDGGGRGVERGLRARGEDEERWRVRRDGRGEVRAEAVGRHARDEDGFASDVG